MIELIVVIAILAILALIAIPRFSGFTERAKIGNDEQYASLIANSTMIMVAAGDMAYNTGDTVTISISPNGSVTAVAGVTFGGTGDLANLAAYNVELLKLVAKTPLESTKYNAGMTVAATDAGVGAKAAATVANP